MISVLVLVGLTPAIYGLLALMYRLERWAT